MNYLTQFLLMVAAALGGNWLWQIWIKKKERNRQKKKSIKDCIEKIRHCIDEIDYNASPGIGGKNSPFKIAEQEELLYAEEVYLLNPETLHALKKSILDVGIVHGHFPHTINHAKSSGLSLKALLEKQREELLSTQKKG